MKPQIFLNDVKTDRRKDRETERQKDIVFCEM